MPVKKLVPSTSWEVIEFFEQAPNHSCSTIIFSSAISLTK